ncbi:hypothetical protein AU381_00140 [Sinorhizobium glycinis]|uniref:Uncharacterized protein n=1 Tax=Sinorhizobium glycinis TaxID=1472378 RepID=A0A178XZV5_9HYPH|nr:hypothetical protein AU381_00140 [Sinorhizobium glycinis]
MLSGRSIAIDDVLSDDTLGVAHCWACAGRGTPPAPKLWFGPPFSPSDALGVDQSAASRSRQRPCFDASVTFSPLSLAVGVAQVDA